MFCSQLFTLIINLSPKTGLTYAFLKYSEDFLKFLYKEFFFLFFFLGRIGILDVSQQYCENFRKIKQKEFVENLPYRFLHNLH